MKTPRLWRRKHNGKEFGAFHVYIPQKRGERPKPINLGTQDADEARRRRARAMRGQTRFRDDNEGAADKVIAALDAVAPLPSPETGRNAGGAPAGERNPSGESAPPPAPAGLLPPMPMADAPAASAGEPVIEPEPIPAGTSWTDDVRDAAGAAPTSTEAPPASTNVRIADIPMLDSAFVFLSRIVVQLQMLGQAVIARKVFKYDLPVLRDEVPKSLAEFAEQQGKPWAPTDPREPGRAMWEKFGRRVCPTDIPIPDWVAAPILVAMGTLPIQVMHGQKIDPAAHPPRAGNTSAPPPAPEAQGGTPDARAEA